MSAEKQNDRIDHQEPWRIQLNQMNAIPGQKQLDKNLAWEHLYDRLKKQPVHRKYPLYWIAAASILGMAVFSGIGISHREIHSVQKQNINQNSPILSLQAVPISKPIPGVSADQERTARIIPPHREFFVHSRSELPTRAQIEIGSKEIKFPPPKALSNSSGALSYLSLLSVKKNFPVLPLNESADWSDPDALSAQKNRQHIFKLKIYNPGNLNLPSLADEQPLNGSIRIPLSTQN